MKEFARILKNLREDRGLSLEKLAEIVGVNKSTLSRYENNQREPDLDTAKKIADYFSVTLDYISGREDAIKPLRTVSLPLLGSIAAGLPTCSPENIIGYMEIPEQDVRGGEYFFLKVKGDSMEGSRIFDGDVVLVRKQETVESGEIAVVRTNNEDATVKRVKHINGQVILLPSNPRYEPIIVKSEDARIIGKVTRVMFDPQ